MKKTGSLTTFFIEVIFALLFLSLATIIIMRIFVSSSVMSDKSREKNTALIIAQNIIEDKQEDGLSFASYYDKNGNISDENGYYFAQVIIDSEKYKTGVLKKIKVEIYGNETGEFITSLESAHYYPESGVLLL